jgi:orotate phosphoribosyltransferase
MTRDLLCQLLRERAYREGSFRLASGRMSTYYLDCRQVVLSPTGLSLCGDVLYQALRDFGLPVHVAGVANGGVPLACAVSLTAYSTGTMISPLIVRKAAKAHGVGGRVVGPQGANKTCVLLEDVVTTGGSAVSAVRALRDEGYDVQCVLVLVDRLEGAAEAFQEAYVPFQSLYTIDEVRSATD